ncbi:hypothetical protein BC938DRAFT_481495 [Jimgerdemannia flammicorona]|uniref:Domain of unknown function at the cortex 1 domain-containing protein n=1 Tax=Jimgerdemannia flammicorona TaxID=994334 RepID=A0A433QWT6_9FUNG|nr:hypothetical protein BC938DRAFT_481495 [Jimgerdemannia flammicorona]
MPADRCPCMPFRLRVLAGPSISDLRPVAVNNDAEPMTINTPHIIGRLCVRIRDFTGIPNPGSSRTSPYFLQNNDQYSIQVQARFKRVWSADDIVFGNEFERKLNLPPGSSIALRFVQWFDPGFEADIFSDRPWAYSPLLVTMNALRVDRGELQEHPIRDTNIVRSRELGLPAWPSLDGERVVESWEPSILSLPQHGVLNDSSERRRHFSVQPNRQTFEITPEHVYDMDFFNPYLDFNNYALRLPGGFRFRVLDYWDGQVSQAIIYRSRKTTLFTNFLIGRFHK